MATYIFNHRGKRGLSIALIYYCVLNSLHFFFSKALKTGTSRHCRCSFLEVIGFNIYTFLKDDDFRLNFILPFLDRVFFSCKLFVKQNMTLYLD